MPIIDTFCDAFKKAINDYETEMAGNIPVKRQPIVVELRALLDKRQQERVDSLRFREEMIEYIKNMPVGAFAFISFFDSRLRKKLQSVLEQPQFSENKLSIAERDEIRSNHQVEMNALKAQITELVNLLVDERAKDNVEAVNRLTLALNQEKKTIAFLTDANTQLNQSVTTLVSKCKVLKKEKATLLQEKTTLQQDYDDLQEKYQALLREKSSTNGRNSHIPQGAFFN